MPTSSLDIAGAINYQLENRHMETIWKITNTGKKDKIKFTVAIASNKSPGVFLEKDEFILAQKRMTTMLDAQAKRGYVSIEEYQNTDNLPIGEVIKMSEKEYAEKTVKDYSK
ncbi:MAG: hypothetical protein P8J32_06430 [bacterium]|nr:hypothetical protein [bacterium]